MSAPPLAFLSYVNFDDDHENGRLRTFAERLAGEVRLQSGIAFEIFIDREDLRWGEQWKARLEESLDAATFLVPMVTPGYFKREWCRKELARFLEREKKLGRGDLILPVYYVRTPEMEKESGDALAEVLRGRQRVDWRHLRFEPWTSPSIGQRLAQMAEQIVEAMDRPLVPLVAAPPSAPRVERAEPTAAAARGPVPEPVPVPEPARPSRNEPPTLVVSQLHRGDGVTIGEVLKKAPAGARILVQPGRYREALVIDKPVEIVGDGPREDIVVEAEGAFVVDFQTTFGRVANLTLRQLGGEFNAVDIAQGRLELEDCDVSSRGLACVGLHDGADPRIRRNRVHAGAHAGVMAYRNGLGVIEDNEVFGNALAGVAIQTGANPTVRKNRIHDGKQGGVHVYENGLGVIEDNDIFGNALAGVTIKTGANPTVCKNRIHDGKQGGVYVYENGLGVIEDNDIFGNALAGVMIRTGANPTVCKNRIHDGKQGGVLVYENGLGVIEDNDIFGNALVGVEIRTGANPTLRKNRIHDEKHAGVHVYENGLGVIEDNDIVDNQTAGVYVNTNGKPTIRNNRIHRNRYHAISIAETGRGTFENNNLKDNKLGPWGIPAEALPHIQRSGNIEQ